MLGRSGIAVTREDVDDDGGQEDVVVEGLLASWQAASTARSPSAATPPKIESICRSPSGALFTFRRTFSMASAEPIRGTAIAQRAGFPSENRHVMPWIVDRLAATEAQKVGQSSVSQLPRLVGSLLSVLMYFGAVLLGRASGGKPRYRGVLRSLSNSLPSS